MKSTLPVEKDLYPFLLYCGDLLRLEKTKSAPRYEETYVDSSEEQTMTAEFVLHHVSVYDFSSKSNKFHYWQSSTSNDFSRSFFDILLDLRCLQPRILWGQLSDPTKDLSEADELIRDLSCVLKKTDVDEVLNFENKIENLRDQFTITKPDQIRKFLLKNHYLLDILAEAPSYIWKVFGRVPIYLEIDSDPEEGWEEMFITIRSPFPAKKAMELENQLRKEWFLSRIEDTRGKLNIIEQPL
jgi:hypothetical protein